MHNIIFIEMALAYLRASTDGSGVFAPNRSASVASIS